MSTESKLFYIPFYWNKKIDMEEMKELFSQLQKDQTITTSYGINATKDIFNKRARIIEWVTFVCKNLNLRNETFFKAIQIFDHFMSMTKVKISTEGNEMQLLAVGCLNLACKLEEVSCNYMSFLQKNLLENENEGYSLKDLASCEQEILRTLKFKLSSPTLYQFNNIFLQIIIADVRKFYKKVNAEAFNFPSFSSFIYQLININDKTLKTFAIEKESIFSAPVTSALICLRTSLILLMNESGLNMANINYFFSKNISQFFKAEFLASVEIVSCNFASSLLNEIKMNFPNLKLISLNNKVGALKFQKKILNQNLISSSCQ